MKIKIKENIIGKIKQSIESTDELNSVEEYINYILEKFIDKLELSEVYSKKDEEKIKKKLKGLGYF